MSTWVSYGGTELARRIERICGIAQETAENLAAELIESENGRIVFITANEIIGNRSSRVRHQWTLTRFTDSMRTSYTLTKEGSQ